MIFGSFFGSKDMESIHLESVFFFSVENKEIKIYQKDGDYISNFRVLQDIIVEDRA